MSVPPIAEETLPPKLTVRPATVRGSVVHQWASRWTSRETHENRPPAETRERMERLLETSYRQAHVFTTVADFEVHVARDGGLRGRRLPPSKSPAAATPLHNRLKDHLIPEGVPCPFLAAIGVMTPAGKVKASKHDKFRQVNRFLELVDDVVDELPRTGALRIVDFGCGKSYLTFALHHLLTAIRGRDVEILGFDRNAEIVERCARLASNLHCAGLEFRVGQIAEQSIEGKVDLAVSLHACDTATDDALAQAVSWNASVILAVPCCQHEVAAKSRIADLAPLQRHGILHERFAALATDALRAQALAARGYRTQIVEFIEMEHTAKNVLIRAVRKPGESVDERALAEYEALKKTLGLASVACDRILAVQSAVGSAIAG